MSGLLLRGGRIYDPAGGIDLVGDVRIVNGRIAELGRELEPRGTVFDVRGCLVLPGFVDLHTHLREPGFEGKGTIASETRAAARGGFTTVCAMPNTDPPPDSAAEVEGLLERFRRDAAVRVFPVGCVTKRRRGEVLAELPELAEAGCVAFSDDGDPVADARLLRRALELSASLERPISDHAVDPALARGGVMHESGLSERLGLPGQPTASEVTAVARDLALAEETGGHVHIAHVTTARAVELIAEAKSRGVRVTAEVTPSHLFLTEHAVWGPGPQPLYDTNAKINPPLRTEEDRRALVAGVESGVIDAIATDHAPHAPEDKACEFDRAAFGISALETAAGIVWTLIARGELTLEAGVRALTAGPVRAFGLQRYVAGLGSLAPGAPADITVVDPERPWVVDPSSFASKGKNTPLAGAELVGKVVLVLVGGEVRFEALRKEEAVG